MAARRTVTKALIRDTLRKAKEVLLNEGWTQGKLVSNKAGATGYCLSGAIGKASGGMTRYGGAWQGRPHERRLWDQTLSEVQSTLRQESGASIPLWNDNKHRTREQVVELIDKTLTRLTPKRRKPAERPAMPPLEEETQISA